jgi:hypothetical protein
MYGDIMLGLNVTKVDLFLDLTSEGDDLMIWRTNPKTTALRRSSTGMAL